jgi:PEP-CTERM motif-containing protein
MKDRVYIRRVLWAVALIAPIAISPGVNAALISRVIIDPNETAAPRFAIDNLTTDTTTLNFGEVATQPVDGLTVNGITFTFTVGGVTSLDALYNTTSGPGLTNLFQPPNMEGDADGVLQLDFAIPTSSISFDFSLFSVGFVGVGGTVRIFDTNLSQIGGVRPINVILPPTGLTEGQFSVAVPEPSTLGLLGIGLLGLGFMRQLRKA